MAGKHVVLVGAGHAHLHVAKCAAAFGRLTLIDPGLFWYSGIATGMLGGTYDRADDVIDPKTLVERHGGTNAPEFTLQNQTTRSFPS